MLRAQAGDRLALEVVLTALQEPLFRVIRRIVVERERSEDALQEALFRIARKLPWLQDPALLRPWAYRIASREALATVEKDRRWRHREDPAQLDLAAEATEIPLETRYELAALAERVAELSPASRAVVSLHYEEELTLPEVAAVLGLPLGTVKSRLAYGLQTLRRHLEGVRR